jgi:hypothetical protein
MHAKTRSGESHRIETRDAPGEIPLCIFGRERHVIVGWCHHRPERRERGPFPGFMVTTLRQACFVIVSVLVAGGGNVTNSQ